ncbi:MAG: hypothetical protein V9E98_03250 [Candidatus Nanopelagicales bacterium]
MSDRRIVIPVAGLYELLGIPMPAHPDIACHRLMSAAQETPSNTLGVEMKPAIATSAGRGATDDR